MRAAALLAALAMPVGAMAQDATAEDALPPTMADLDRIVAAVPDQPWYPKGYYDLRIAAEAQVAGVPLTPRTTPAADGTAVHNLVDCRDPEIEPGDAGDAASAEFGNVAMQVARMRSNLSRLGFPAAAYAEPMTSFERQRIGLLEDDAKAEAANGDAAIPDAVTVTDSDGNSLSLDAWTASLYQAAAAINAKRGEPAAKLPKLIVRGSCFDRSPGWAAAPEADDPVPDDAPDNAEAPDRGSPDDDSPPNDGSVIGAIVGAIAIGPIVGGQQPTVRVTTVPAAAEVWLISAFAFNVCTRRQPDPWNHLACRWQEVETGRARSLDGRYIYHIRWPDGAERKGVRDIGQGDGTVTFRKTGS